MSREWAPGEVAMIGVAPNGAVGVWTGEFWAWVPVDHTGPYDGVAHCHRDVVAHPLIVIDPENPDDLNRICKALVEKMYAAGDRHSAANGIHPATMQAALRSLTEPDRPDEPTRDGALVECDYDGKRGKAVLLGGSWTFYGESLRDHGAIYDDFENVRVLSEGVTP